jgi:hypothetical protein
MEPLERMILNLVFYLEDNQKSPNQAVAPGQTWITSEVSRIWRKHQYEPPVNSMLAFLNSQRRDELPMLEKRDKLPMLEKAAAEGDLLGTLASANFYDSQVGAAPSQENNQKLIFFKGLALEQMGVDHLLNPQIFNEATVSEGFESLSILQKFCNRSMQPGQYNFYWFQRVASQMRTFIKNLRQNSLSTVLRKFVAILEDPTKKPVYKANSVRYFGRGWRPIFEQEIASMATQPPRLQGLWGEFLRLRKSALATERRYLAQYRRRPNPYVQ